MKRHNHHSEVYAAQLAARLAELSLVRTQLEAGRHGPKRQLLDQRLDAVQARAADVFARLIEARAAA